jgi:hypothetical protein
VAEAWRRGGGGVEEAWRRRGGGVAEAWERTPVLRRVQLRRAAPQLEANTNAPYEHLAVAARRLEGAVRQVRTAGLRRHPRAPPCAPTPHSQ